MKHKLREHYGDAFICFFKFSEIPWGWSPLDPSKPDENPHSLTVLGYFFRVLEFCHANFTYPLVKFGLVFNFATLAKSINLTCNAAWRSGVLFDGHIPLVQTRRHERGMSSCAGEGWALEVMPAVPFVGRRLVKLQLLSATGHGLRQPVRTSTSLQ
jgi:hypothetical protein